jgi:hypothetical protein
MRYNRHRRFIELWPLMVASVGAIFSAFCDWRPCVSRKLPILAWCCSFPPIRFVPAEPMSTSRRRPPGKHAGQRGDRAVARKGRTNDRSRTAVQKQAAVYLARRIRIIEASIAVLEERTGESAADADDETLHDEMSPGTDVEIGVPANQLRTLRMQAALRPNDRLRSRVLRPATGQRPRWEPDHSVAARARSRTPAVAPTYMSSVIR